MRLNSTNILRRIALIFGSHALKIQQLWERLTLSHITKMNTFLQ
jgi:hypothetical protein